MMMEDDATRVARQSVEKARAKLTTVVMFRRLMIAGVIASIALVLEPITLCVLEILTTGEAAAYVVAGLVLGILTAVLMAYVHDTKQPSITDARHALENAQTHYYKLLGVE